jgi:hypothetical protein
MGKRYGKAEVVSLDHYLELLDQRKEILVETGVAEILAGYRVLQTQPCGSGWVKVSLFTPTSN